MCFCLGVNLFESSGQSEWFAAVLSSTFMQGLVRSRVSFLEVQVPVHSCQAPQTIKNRAIHSILLRYLLFHRRYCDRMFLNI